MFDRSIICSYHECTACAACMNVCAHNAITLQEDGLGYLYPQIDLSLCVECALCRMVCPALHPLALYKPQSVYAAVSRNQWEHLSSSSGGAASVISRYVIKSGGVVYGCSQSNYCDIKHVRVDKATDVDSLKGSKYVQSEIGLCYRKIKQDLLANKTVLFVGTPCQVAGLKSFLRKEYKQLYTIDLVCHGVAPQRMLCENVESNSKAERKKNREIYVNFRWKTKYGIRFGIQLCQKERDRLSILKSIRFPYNAYITAFMTGLSFRENCHQCVYAGVKRVGDWTIGDFWGLGAYQKTQIVGKAGVSLLMVNTDKGNSLLQEVKDAFILEKRTLFEAVHGNANLKSASVRPKNKDLFKQVLSEKGLNAACHAALSCKQYFILVLIEEIKRVPFLMTTFKKIRLSINRMKKSM